jgi:hypothetical protein
MEKEKNIVKTLTLIPLYIAGIMLLMFLGSCINIKMCNDLLTMGIMGAFDLILICFVMSVAGLAACLLVKRKSGYYMAGYIILGIINLLLFGSKLLYYFLLLFRLRDF